MLIGRYVFLIALAAVVVGQTWLFENGALTELANMPTHSTITAAGATDAGRQREGQRGFASTLTSRRGLFIVIDGLSAGQAAGGKKKGKAADVALCMLRERLERETGPVRERVPRGDYRRQQRNSSDGLHPPGVGRHGVRS
jgi:hypothetical protein